MSERVLLVEDHALLAESLAGALRQQGHVVETAEITAPSDVDEVLPLAEEFLPSLVLLDLDLAGADGLPLIRPLNQTGARVAVLSASTDRIRHARCVREGASGVLLKSVHFNELVAAIDALASGKPLLDGNQRAELLRELRQAESEQDRARTPFEHLTAAQQEVLRLLTQGHSAAQIAEERVVSLATVRTHIHHILRTLQVDSQVEAVVLAHQAGWPATEEPHQFRGGPTPPHPTA